MKTLPTPVTPLLCLLFLGVWAACTPPKSDKDYTDRMHAEHQHENPTATPATTHDIHKDAGKMITFGREDGQEFKGYYVKRSDTKANAPGLIMIHEWWGLNDNIKAMAEKYAALGYKVLAVDMYNGTVATKSDEAMPLMRAATNDFLGSRKILKAGYTFLKNEKAAKIGSIGWCMGGFFSLQAAIALPQALNATVIYYGDVSKVSRDELASLQMPILGHFGGLDKGIPLSSVQQFEATLRDLKKNVTINVYDQADHAFANPSGQRYNPVAAEDAWSKTQSFFQKHLQ
ncbi:MAG: dienelactone hydrolase family protein [Bacteroidetes Order II. Incertae sedis bacterium]|nr:dienelactone hydrolase family protein [Bacteroidetes Order II. bacterium]